MHGVRERLQAARRHAADGADQRQDASVHQLAGWGERERGGEEGGTERKEGSCYSQYTRGDGENKQGTPVDGPSSSSVPLFVG